MSTEVVETSTEIDEERVRSLALKLDPFVKVGREPPVTNLKRSGYLADVVERIGWDEALQTFPEVGQFLLRLRGTLAELVAAAAPR